MQRAYFAVFSWLAMTGSLLASTTTLSFSAPVPGTIADSNGLGTGFTTRMPETGSAIPPNDPYLTLDTANHQLIVNSTRSDFNTTGFGKNLAGMDSPALLLSGIGAGDFIVRAQFNNLNVDQASDQTGIFVGTSADSVLRGGIAEDIPNGGYQTFFNFSQNGTDGAPNNGVLANFQSGQNGVFEFGRIGGVWHFSWHNLSNPSNSGSFNNFSVAGLDSQSDLYVGIFNDEARNVGFPYTTNLESFTVLTGSSVPEPSSVVL